MVDGHISKKQIPHALLRNILYLVCCTYLFKLFSCSRLLIHIRMVLKIKEGKKDIKIYFQKNESIFMFWEHCKPSDQEPSDRAKAFHLVDWQINIIYESKAWEPAKWDTLGPLTLYNLGTGKKNKILCLVQERAIVGRASQRLKPLIRSNNRKTTGRPFCQKNTGRSGFMHKHIILEVCFMQNIFYHLLHWCSKSSYVTLVVPEIAVTGDRRIA